jgi:hypothetical protein
MKGLEETAIELIASAIGWLVCMAIASGAFGLGFATASWWGGVDPKISGMLSVIALVWLYEHRLAHSRWEKLNERLDRLWEKAAGLD